MSGMEVLTSFVGTAEQIVHAQRYANRFKELKELRDRVLCEPIESEGINANQRYSPIKPQSQPYIADFPVSFVKRGELPESSKERVSLQTYIDPNDETCLADFFDHDLDVGKLNILQRTLGWAAGREVSVPPLHRQLGDMGRRIIATERADLHMLWQDDILYLKPLPGYLFMESSWTVLRQNEVRWKNALGFLRTYIDLIRSEMDFDFALDTTDHARLLPKLRHPLPPGVDGPESSSFELTYKDWSEFARGFNEQSKGTLITALSGTRWEFDTL